MWVFQIPPHNPTLPHQQAGAVLRDRVVPLRVARQARRVLPAGAALQEDEAGQTCGTDAVVYGRL